MARKNHEPNPYFALHHGRKVMRSQIQNEAHYTTAAVDALMVKGEIIGQYTLPNPETGEQDMQLWMPERVKDREEAVEVKIDKIRAELAAIGRGDDFDPSIYDPRMPAPEPPKLPYVEANGNGHIDMQEGVWYKIPVASER